MSQSKLTSFFRARKIADTAVDLKNNDKSRVTTPNLTSDGSDCNRAVLITPSSKLSTPTSTSLKSTKNRKRKRSLEGQSSSFDPVVGSSKAVPHCPARKRLLLGNDTSEVDVSSLKMKLNQSGKLEEVKNIVNKIKESSSKLQLTDKPTTTKDSRPPAFERFIHLTSKDSFPLPRKFKDLSEAFHSTDVVVSMMHNKKEIIHFSYLKSAVEKLLKRVFNISTLGQILTVYPKAYVFKERTTKCKKSEDDFVIQPNFCNESTSQNDCDSAWKGEMTPAVLLRRRSAFNCSLLNIAKKHHEKFLASLKPPIKISSNLLLRWHPSFPVDSIPDIEPATFPEQLENKTCTTAQDLLNKFQGIPYQRVASALKQVAERSKETVSQPPKDVTVDKLKGISKSLLEKIRARQAQKLAKEMTCPPDVKYNQMMLSRLPEILKIVRSYFIAERRAAIRVEDVVKNVRENFHTPISLADTEQHINLIAMLFPDWLFVITLKKGTFLKIDKDRILEDLISRLNDIVPKE